MGRPDAAIRAQRALCRRAAAPCKAGNAPLPVPAAVRNSRTNCAIPVPAAIGQSPPGVPAAIRLRVDSREIRFTDRIQGTYRQQRSGGGWRHHPQAPRSNSCLRARGGGRRCRAGRHPYRSRRRSFGQHAASDLPATAPGICRAALCPRAGADRTRRRQSWRSRGAVSRPARILPCRGLLTLLSLLGLAPPACLEPGPISAAWTWAIGQWRRR